MERIICGVFAKRTMLRVLCVVSNFNMVWALIEPKLRPSCPEAPPSSPKALKRRTVAITSVNMQAAVVESQRLALADANQMCFFGRYGSGSVVQVEVFTNRRLEARQFPTVLSSVAVCVSMAMIAQVWSHELTRLFKKRSHSISRGD